MSLLRIIVMILSVNMLLVYAADDAAEPADQVATNNIPSCKENDENINECLLRVFDQMIPRSKNGIPELNIPAIDPLIINKTSYIFSHPIFEGKLTALNMKVHGLSNIKTNTLDYKHAGDRLTLITNAQLPKLFVEGLYKAKVRLNTATIASRGPFNVTFSNINVTSETMADVYERDGHWYLKIKSFNFDPIVGNMVFHAEGLVEEPLLNEAILEFINQNWRTIYKTIIPETRAAWEPEFVKIGNEYFSHIPIDAVLKRE